MHDRLVIRTHLDGPVAVVAAYGSALSGALHTPGENLRTTIDMTLAGLPADPMPAPVPITSWLRMVSEDNRLPAQARQAGMIIGLTPDGSWIGISAMANKLHCDWRNVPRAIRPLLELGYLDRTKDGTRVIYSRRLP